MKKNIKGQSLIEFAVSISVLIALLVSIPIVAKIANVNIMSIQALDYAAWRVREGNTDNTLLSQEVSDRYFAETALIVDNEKIAQGGANLGTGRNNQQIYRPDTVTVNYTPDNSPTVQGLEGASWNSINDAYDFGMYSKKGTLSINVPLENLDVIPEIASSMVIKKSLYIDSQTLSARDADAIQESMDNFDNSVIPFNSGAQSAIVNTPINAVILGLRVATLPITVLLNENVFDHYTLSDVAVKHDEVPADRLAVFVP